MQQVLSFTQDGKKYISRVFDFEAFCRINERHLSKDLKGVPTICAPVIDYMFEGTEADEEVLSKLDVHEKFLMCKKLWDWYGDAIGPEDGKEKNGKKKTEAAE